MMRAWETDENSFALIRKNDSEQFVVFLIMDEVIKMAELVNAELSKAQLKFVVNYILQNYWYFTISDITALTCELIREKTYGKPLLQNIIIAIDKWDVARQDFAIDQREKESSMLKSDTYSQTEIAEVYINLKNEKENKLSRKQKDKIACLKNQDKIKEIELLYPNNK